MTSIWPRLLPTTFASGRGPAPLALAAELDSAARGLVDRAAATGLLRLAYGRRPSGSELTTAVDPDLPAAGTLLVFGEGTNTLRVHCRAVPYALAAVLIAVRDRTGLRPVCHFPWTGKGRYGPDRDIVLGQTGTPAQVRALLRHAEPDARRRPIVLIGD